VLVGVVGVVVTGPAPRTTRQVSQYPPPYALVAKTSLDRGGGVFGLISTVTVSGNHNHHHAMLAAVGRRSTRRWCAVVV